MSQKGEYFRSELTVANAADAVWLDVTNLAVLTVSTNSDVAVTNLGNLFLPQTPELFAHDADGNLTNDGRWSYTWDAENRLVRLVSRPETPADSRRALTFGYDPQARRISLTVSNWVDSAWELAADQRFVYDGWNLLAILNSSFSLLNSFTWGLDLSGSQQGAGGVGGLLAVSDAEDGMHFASADGNGNVMLLVNAADSSVSARYEYGPFGELIRATGPMATVNPFRFSTKYQDSDTDLLYYGYRSYSPAIGRWLSRDPIGERGGRSLYLIVANNPVNKVDKHGLFDVAYIHDGRRWNPETEWFWMGVSFGFDASDAKALNGKGIMMTHYSASVDITHCAGPKSYDSADFYQANRFFLNEKGWLSASTDYAYPFTDGTVRIPFQMANWSSERLFWETPHVKFNTQDRRQIRAYRNIDGWRTRGHFTARLDYQILPVSGDEWLDEFFQPGGSQRAILTPEYIHDKWTTDEPPSIWGNYYTHSGSISISFEWDDCCGKRWYKYTISPKGLPKGANRFGQQSVWPGFVVPEEE